MIDKEKVLTGLECCSMNGNGCKRCPYNKDCDEMPDFGNAYLCFDALELLKDQQETIASLQGTICKLNAALAEQPEQKHGHWISYGYGYYRCSVCNDGKNMNFVPDYCSTCGAKMDEEVKQDENIS